MLKKKPNFNPWVLSMTQMKDIKEKAQEGSHAMEYPPPQVEGEGVEPQSQEILADPAGVEMAPKEMTLAQVDVQLKRDLEHSQEKYMRLLAEFENFKKRAERERQTSVKFANESILTALLSVLDHFYQALGAIKQAKSTDSEKKLFDMLESGLQMVFKQFEDVLGKFGVQAFSGVGEKFNPALHEALLEKDSIQVPAGTIMEEFQKGYMLHDRLIRPARVVVAKEPSAVNPLPEESIKTV